jgi:hypothetical protein
LLSFEFRLEVETQKWSPSGHFKNQNSTIITHQSNRGIAEAERLLGKMLFLAWQFEF